MLPTGYFRYVYKPEGRFINDHCLIRHEDTWHLFYIHGLEKVHWTHPENQLDLGHAISTRKRCGGVVGRAHGIRTLCDQA